MAAAIHLNWKRSFVNSTDRARVMAIVSVAVWTATVASAFHFGRVWLEWGRGMRIQKAQAEKLARLQDTVEKWQRAAEEVERSVSGPMQSFKWEKTPLVREGALSLLKEEREPLQNGWRLYRLRFEGREVPLAGLSDFLASAEEAVPPLRLAGLTIEALDNRAGGRGRVVLELETLEKETR